MSFEKVRRLRVSLMNIKNEMEADKNKVEKIKETESLNLMTPTIISYYADFSDNKYYENYAHALIERCKKFGVVYDVSELESRGDYGVNCLMKPEFILGKIKESRKPLIWMDCDTDFREPFSHFNGVQEDIGMATHSGELNGIKASPLYFNYTKGAFRIIREWVIHCRACYDLGIVELDHDALKHYVLEFLKGAYTPFLLTDNWNDFVHGRYIWNGNSRVDGKIQIHRKVGVSDEIRRSYTKDVKHITLFFASQNKNVFSSASNFLNKFSDRSRISFNFSPKLLLESSENPDFKLLEIESGGLVYFNATDFDSYQVSKNEIFLFIKDVIDIQNEWDLLILKMINGDVNPLYVLNFDDGGKGFIKIKSNSVIWI